MVGGASADVAVLRVTATDAALQFGSNSASTGSFNEISRLSFASVGTGGGAQVCASALCFFLLHCFLNVVLSFV